jgi:hypothetical protein
VFAQRAGGRASPAMRAAAAGEPALLTLSELQAILLDVFETKISANVK